jgi:hypothetical protein
VRQVILVERSPRDGGEWTQVGPLNGPNDLRGSGTAILDGENVLVVFGWDTESVPRVWRDDGISVKLGRQQRGHVGPAEQLVALADLRDGPFELDGPNARWRWSLISAS